MNWVPLESSVLAAASYSSDEHVLYLQFHSGETYQYFGFQPEQYRDLLAAESKGTYLNRHIRHRFRYEQLPQSFQAGS